MEGSKLKVMVVSLAPYYAGFKNIQELVEKMRSIVASRKFMIQHVSHDASNRDLAKWIKPALEGRNLDYEFFQEIIDEFNRDLQKTRYAHADLLKAFNLSVKSHTVEYSILSHLCDRREIIILCDTAVDAKHIYDCMRFHEDERFETIKY